MLLKLILLKFDPVKLNFKKKTVLLFLVQFGGGVYGRLPPDVLQRQGVQ